MSDEHMPAQDLEVVQPTAIEAQERATVDVQISTAKRYPRSLQTFKQGAIAMATFDEETAESCLYRRPVGKKPNGTPQYAEGMSVRMAEIVGANYGNLRVSAQIVEQTERFVKARGMAIDLQTNFAASTEVIESTVKRDGRPYDERMRIVIAKSCLAKARRDATFIVVPRALAKPIETEVRKVLMGDSKTIEQRRTAVMSWINKIGIDVSRVWAAIGVKGESDLGVEQLETLTGIRTAIKENDTTIDEAFPVPGALDLTEKPDLGKVIHGTTSAQAANQTANDAPAKSTVQSSIDRDTLVTHIENALLDNRVKPDAALKYAIASLGADKATKDLLDLPNEILAKVLAEIPKLKK